MGERYTPPSSIGIENREALERQFGRAAGVDYGAAQQLQKTAMELGDIATGREMGAGERAARQAGERAFAQTASLAAGARGPGAAAARRRAMQLQALQSTGTRATAAEAAAQEQRAAQAMRAQILSGLQAQQLAGLGAIGGLRGQDLQAELTRQGLLQGSARPGALGGLIAAGGQIGGAALMASDERIKKDAKAINSKDLSKRWLLVKPSQFKYQEEYDEEGRGRNYLGVMAQDMEKAYPEMVVEDERGVKNLDLKRSSGLLLASVADLYQRMEVMDSKDPNRAMKEWSIRQDTRDAMGEELDRQSGFSGIREALGMKSNPSHRMGNPRPMANMLLNKDNPKKNSYSY